MEKISLFLKDLISKSASRSPAFKRNLLKEYLQILTLDFLYSHEEYSQMSFYGDSCLSHCFGLPRLSEDLDFVDLKGRVAVSHLAHSVEAYFRERTDLEAKASIQKFRVHLKLPILREVGLAGRSDSDLLFLKIEVYREFDFCKKYKVDIIPLFKFNRSILVKTFDLPTLMSTKIRALLYRKWKKTGKKGRTLATVKGRDYFDLMWYLGKGIKPNLDCLENIKSESELKEKLLRIVGRVDAKSIQLDLEDLIEDKNYVMNVSSKIKEILLREIAEKL